MTLQASSLTWLSRTKSSLEPPVCCSSSPPSWPFLSPFASTLSTKIRRMTVTPKCVQWTQIISKFFLLTLPFFHHSWSPHHSSSLCHCQTFFSFFCVTAQVITSIYFSNCKTCYESNSKTLCNTQHFTAFGFFSHLLADPSLLSLTTTTTSIDIMNGWLIYF